MHRSYWTKKQHHTDAPEYDLTVRGFVWKDCLTDLHLKDLNVLKCEYTSGTTSSITSARMLIFSFLLKRMLRMVQKQEQRSNFQIHAYWKAFSVE